MRLPALLSLESALINDFDRVPCCHMYAGVCCMGNGSDYIRPTRSRTENGAHGMAVIINVDEIVNARILLMLTDVAR